MSDVTNLRQAKNKIECVGILAEKDLHAGKNQNNGKATIEGYVSIKVDEINQVRFRVQADETKKDGTSNPAYENLTAFNQNASSIAEVGVDNASRVRTASGQLNPYHSQQNNSDVLGYRTSFITVMNGGEEFEPNAEATVDGKVVTIKSPVSSPTKLRYAWKDDPQRANLYGTNGLPVAPFELPILRK